MTILAAFLVGVGVCLSALVVIVKWDSEWKFGWRRWKGKRLSWRPRWWLRWSPWVLRARVRDLGRWLNDERKYHADDRTNTDYEQNWRYVNLVLDGHPDPGGESARFRVEGSTLVIDATNTRPTPTPARSTQSDDDLVSGGGDA